jgi:hypothetical protein
MRLCNRFSQSIGWSYGAAPGCDIAITRPPGGDQPALPRFLDRLDPSEHARRTGDGFWIFCRPIDLVCYSDGVIIDFIAELGRSLEYGG